jgi:hypothetical protein
LEQKLEAANEMIEQLKNQTPTTTPATTKKPAVKKLGLIQQTEALQKSLAK